MPARAENLLNDISHGSPYPTSVPDRGVNLNLRMLVNNFTEGGMNTNSLMVDQHGIKYMWRTSRNNRGMVPALEEQFEETGFTKSGGTFHVRSLSEQTVFMRHANAEGLAVLTPTYEDERGMLVPFIQGESLEEYVSRGEHAAVSAVLEDLTSAHAKGIYYGDRWPKNIHVTSDAIVEFDFDIALNGASAAEFELAQFFYGVISNAADKQRVLQACSDVLKKVRDGQYNTALLNQFVANIHTYMQRHSPKDAMSDQEAAEINLKLQSM